MLLLRLTYCSARNFTLIARFAVLAPATQLRRRLAARSLSRNVFHVAVPRLRLAPLKLARCPRSLAPTLVALPSMSLIPQLHSAGFAGPCADEKRQQNGGVRSDDFIAQSSSKRIDLHFFRVDNPKTFRGRQQCAQDPDQDSVSG